MTVSPDELRYAMRRWTTGVTIVTAQHDGIRHGMTVSTFTSLSLEPPYVMVSLERSTRTHDLVIQSGAFGVTILADNQQPISDSFANSKTELGFRFEGVETFSLMTGAPFIRGGLAFFDCRTIHALDAGTHSVFVGEVVSVKEGGHEPPLVYFYQRYRGLAQEKY